MLWLGSDCLVMIICLFGFVSDWCLEWCWILIVEWGDGLEILVLFIFLVVVCIFLGSELLGVCDVG